MHTLIYKQRWPKIQNIIDQHLLLKKRINYKKPFIFSLNVSTNNNIQSKRFSSNPQRITEMMLSLLTRHHRRCCCCCSIRPVYFSAGWYLFHFDKSLCYISFLRPPRAFRLAPRRLLSHSLSYESPAAASAASIGPSYQLSYERKKEKKNQDVWQLIWQEVIWYK